MSSFEIVAFVDKESSREHTQTRRAERICKRFESVTQEFMSLLGEFTVRSNNRNTNERTVDCIESGHHVLSEQIASLHAHDMLLLLFVCTVFEIYEVI